MMISIESSNNGVRQRHNSNHSVFRDVPSTVSSDDGTTINNNNDSTTENQNDTDGRREFHRTSTQEELKTVMKEAMTSSSVSLSSLSSSSSSSSLTAINLVNRTNASCSKVDSISMEEKNHGKDNSSSSVEKYFASREMTPLQERINAITVLPAAMYCLYFCCSGAWINATALQVAAEEEAAMVATAATNTMVTDLDGCWMTKNAQTDHTTMTISWMKQLLASYFIVPPSLPPVPVLAVTIGIVLHTPCSCIYHWKYAHAIRCVKERSEHWSRRLDQTMIHFAFTCFTLSTSGSYLYLVINALYALDCAKKLFWEQEVNPKRNQIRLALAMMAYTFPMLFLPNQSNPTITEATTMFQDDNPTTTMVVTDFGFLLFLQTALVLLSSGYFFIAYPLGGWSHSIFHIIICFLPPLLMRAACQLPMSQDVIQLGAKCLHLSQS